MTLKELEDKLKGKVEVKKVAHLESFVVGCGDMGAITIQFKNDKFTKLIIDGKEKEKLQDIVDN